MKSYRFRHVLWACGRGDVSTPSFGSFYYVFFSLFCTMYLSKPGFNKVTLITNFIPSNLYYQANLKVCRPWCTPIPLGQSRLSCPRLLSSWVGGPCLFFPKIKKITDVKTSTTRWDKQANWQENKWRVLVLLKASFYYTILLIENKCPGSKGKINLKLATIIKVLKLMFYRQRFHLSPVIWLIFFSGINKDGLRFLLKIIFKLSTSKRL